MTPVLLFLLACGGTAYAGKRSLRAGIAAVICVGYAYGIVRANILHTLTHLLFDGAVLALYMTQLFEGRGVDYRYRTQDLRVWLVLLIAWPTLLFAVFPGNAPLVELVGWRANVFLLPFLLLGARLDDEDIYEIARVVAILNIGAALVGSAEFVLGIDRFFPENAVTEIIFKSKDLVGRTAYRIPSTFTSGHAYAGTMVLTLPFLTAGWMRSRGGRWHLTFGIAIIATVLGVFMAAARIHTVVAAILIVVATFSGGMALGQRFRWVLALAVIVWVVGGDERLQRFTTLRDTEMIATRVSGSVNESFVDVVSDTPSATGSRAAARASRTSSARSATSGRTPSSRTSTRASPWSRGGSDCCCGLASSGGR